MLFSEKTSSLEDMDPAFKKGLLERGVGEAVLVVLQSQNITGLRVFRAMKEEHMVSLLKCEGMPIGSHALLWEMWEECTTSPRIHSRSEFLLPASFEETFQHHTPN